MKNNKGLSYYELLIVVTIMGLMAAFVTISIGTVNRNNVNRAADNVESSIKAARNNAMSKGNKYGYVNFYYKDKKLFAYIGEEVITFDSSRDWKEIGNGIDKVTIVGSGDLYSGSIYSISFKQSTGESSKGDVTICLKKGSSTESVSVGRFGQISVE